jgi:hypothetical protein
LVVFAPRGAIFSPASWSPLVISSHDRIIVRLDLVKTWLIVRLDWVKTWFIVRLDLVKTWFFNASMMYLGVRFFLAPQLL